MKIAILNDQGAIVREAQVPIRVAKMLLVRYENLNGVLDQIKSALNLTERKEIGSQLWDEMLKATGKTWEQGVSMGWDNLAALYDQV